MARKYIGIEIIPDAKGDRMLLVTYRDSRRQKIGIIKQPTDDQIDHYRSLVPAQPERPRE